MKGRYKKEVCTLRKPRSGIISENKNRVEDRKEEW